MDTVTLPAPKTTTREKCKRQPPFHVILLNDDDHTFHYVIRMLKELFGYPDWKGMTMAEEVHTTGRVIVCTTSKERAELKRDQIHAFGPDPDATHSAGSMSAEIEPAESGDE